jgi:hypothetical protein
VIDGIYSLQILDFVFSLGTGDLAHCRVAMGTVRNERMAPVHHLKWCEFAADLFCSVTSERVGIEGLREDDMKTRTCNAKKQTGIISGSGR